MAKITNTIFIHSNAFSELYFCFNTMKYISIKHDYETKGTYNADLITDEVMPKLSFFSIYSGQCDNIVPIFRFRDLYIFENKIGHIESIERKYVKESYMDKNIDMLNKI